MTPFTSTLNTSSHNRPYSDQAPRPVTMIVSPAPRDSEATTAAGPKQPASFHIFLSENGSAWIPVSGGIVMGSALFDWSVMF